MNVKEEIDNLKKSTTNSLATSQARQEARYFNKQNPKDLHEAVRTDFKTNYDKYLPNNVALQVQKIVWDFCQG